MSLRSYLLKRAFNTVILILFVITLNFVIFELMPGTQTAIENLAEAPGRHNPAVVTHLEHVYGFCQPQPPEPQCVPATLLDRFSSYFTSMITFNFGIGFQSGRPVLDEMIQTGKLTNTLLLLGLSTALSLVIGIFLGVYAASKRGSLFDSGWVTTSLVTYSLPTFFMGILFVLVFTQMLQWFPVGGVTPPTWIIHQPDLWTYIIVRLQYLFLPVLTLTLFFYGGHLLLTRATMVEALGEDYIMTARAKGVSERSVLFKHALKNASLPIVTNAALSFGFILSGAIITETVFSWDGLGLWIWKSIQFKDFPVMQAMFFIIALCVIVANLISDIVYGMLDPRIKYQ